MITMFFWMRERGRLTVCRISAKALQPHLCINYTCATDVRQRKIGHTL